ncbi:hypothetical protein ABIF38_002888 [Bradyrhizobium japonicum]|uniref:Uncharacterized protein n=1 Tax=Bradyrhizobium elkanii TaxID=29448 RepID=A0ABV4FEN7_BRAEL|nr:hypothetical protein [Bradyrhizobium elkanii]MCP1734800.1 hypothetical protein [Bradyrhizobium elkanii]MCP1752906.1 hypothetical protein [Bradyrhizobium elkanii]MCP1975346.1 hypothetical protein [Bradyrhizobium elkanii]MCS3570139.1 hypothetical protein [Bradyrhizobium elkanii]
MTKYIVTIVEGEASYLAEAVTAAADRRGSPSRQFGY